MKHVFKTSELPHLWANQTREEVANGREARGADKANEKFRGRDYFSYWAVIGRIHDTAKGRAFVVSRKRYSVTTSAHESGVRRATHGENVFSVDSWADVSPKEIRAGFIREAQDFVAQASKARSRAAGLLASASNCITQANRANEFFGLRFKPFALDLDAELARARELTAKAAQRAKDAKIQKEIAEAKRDALADQFRPQASALWRAHNDAAGLAEFKAAHIAAGLEVFRTSDLLTADQRAAGFSCVLRLSADRSRVETSQGAQVLVRTVRFLWAFCSTAKATQTAVDADTLARFPRLENYTCNEIDAQGNVRADCHSIPFAEIEGIARELGLPPFNGEPAEAPEIPAVNEEVTT